MRVKIQVYGFLRSLLGSGEVYLEAPDNSSLKEVLALAASQFPGLREAVDPGGRLRPYFVLFVNGTDYELLGGYGYAVKEGDTLQLLPISHGGGYSPLQSYMDRVNSVRVRTCLVSEDMARELLSHIDSVGPGCVAQVIPRAYYYGASYSALVAYLTLRSMARGLNVSRKKSLEFLLYYFGDRQIDRVLDKLQESRSSEYVVIHACLGDPEPGDGIYEVVSRCRAEPTEPQRPPEEALVGLVRGVLRLLA